MDYEKLKEVIAKVIKENGQGEITGPALQMVLMAMVNSLGEVYPQTYTTKQKAQARANIDALSNYDGEITKEKLAQSIQDTLNKVGMNVKVLPDGTDLLSEDLEEGIYVVDNITMMMDNVPKDLGFNCLALLIVTSGGERTIFGLDTDQYPFVSYKNSDGEWAYVKLGTVGTENIADGAITEDKLASQSVSSKKIKDATIGASKLGAKSVTEPKLNDTLTEKVNNNVKTVEQTLTDSEIAQASENLKFRDNYRNFFANRYSYESVKKLSVKPNYHIFGNSCINNTFGTNCYYTTLGNNCRSNTFGSDCVHNILGDGCSYNIFGKSLECSKIDSGITYIELRSNASTGRSLKNIHILSGVRGTINARLVINIPDEYLDSSRELIITTKRTDGGPSTPEDLVMYYADEVAEKQNKQDTTLKTTSKEVVGAINELFNGGVKDKSIEIGKLAQAVQDTLGKVGTNIKVLPAGTDLLSDNIEEGIYLLLTGSGTYDNYPYSKGLNPGRPAILVKVQDNYLIIGTDSGSSDEFPIILVRIAGYTYWYGNSIANKFYSKLDASAGSVKTNNLANGAVTTDKLADRVLTLLQGSVPVSKLSSLFGTEITLNLVERADTGHTVYDIEESGLVEVRAFEESWKGLFGTLEGCRFAANILFQGQYSTNIVERQYIFVREQKKSKNSTYTAIVNLVRPGGVRTRAYHLYEISIHLGKGYADVLKATPGDGVVLNLNERYASTMDSYVDLNTIGGSDPNKVVYFQYNDTSKGLLEGVGRTYPSPTSPGETSWFDGITFDGKYKIHAEAYRSDSPIVTVTENGPKDLEALKTTVSGLETTVSGLETTVAQQQVSLAQISNDLNPAMQAIRAITKVMVTALNLTEDTASNKLAYDNLLLDKSFNPPEYIPLVSISCTYKNDYAGTLHKIGTDWFGQLVKNTNNYEDCICIKLAADGTVTEGTTSLKAVNAKLDTIIG